VSLFLSCDRDDDGVTSEAALHTQEHKTTRVNLDEIPEISSYIETLGNGRKQLEVLTPSRDSRSTEPDLVIGEIQTSEIIAVTNQVDKTNYTFLLRSIEGVQHTVSSTFNLVINESSRGVFSYIMEYRPALEWHNSYLRPQDMSTFTGDILYYRINGQYVGKVGMQQGDSVSVENRNPCDNQDGNSNDFGTNGIDGEADTGNTTGNTDTTGNTGTSDNTDNDTGSTDTNGTGSNCDFTIAADCPGEDNCGEVVFIPIDCGGDQNFTDTSIGNAVRTLCGEDNECYESNGDPCEDSTDDAPVGVLMQVFEDDPCKDLKNVTVNNAEVRVKLNQLLVNGQSNNREQVFKVRKNLDTNLDSPTDLTQGNQECSEARVSNLGFTFLAAHSHPLSENCNLFGMFSGGDILQLAKMATFYQGQGATHFNTYTFILTYDLKAYAIKFDKQEAVESLIDIYTNSEKFIDFRKQFIRDYEKLADQPGEIASESELMSGMFDILEGFNLDISLYKAATGNNFVTGWNKINQETLQQEPCN